MSTQRHIPVLLNEVVDAIAPRDGGRYLDGTFGAGGYTTAMLDRADCRVIAIDRELAEQYAPRLTLIEGRYGDMAELLSAEGVDDVDGVTLDLGVSSMQFDQAERGFSFRNSGPLDMRMGRSGPSAADLVNDTEEDELADIIWRYGEERKSRRVAHGIVEQRKLKRIETTAELASIVRRAVGPQAKDDSDPATRTFQALRIAVNDELGELERGLAAAEAVLAPGGRLAVVSFHSLEDRAVKEFVRARAGQGRCGCRHSARSLAQAGAAVGRRDTVQSARPFGAAAGGRKDLPRLRGRPRMIHRGLLFWSIAAIGTAMGLFSVKYRVQDLEEKIDRTNQKIVESQQATHILQIEWDYLNEAARIERLAQTHLKLEQASIKQVIRLESLSASPSTATASTASVPPRRDSPLPSPPRTGTDVPSSRMPGGDRVAGGQMLSMQLRLRVKRKGIRAG
jgi:16S rRNA (cytosine1402-N4)-methyltransferase